MAIALIPTLAAAVFVQDGELEPAVHFHYGKDKLS
jgi:hypothetical protein